MEEQNLQNEKMEFQQLSFNGDTNTESSYMGLSLQQTPQAYVDFLSQNGVSQIQNQMFFNDELITVNLNLPVSKQEQESNNDYCSHIFKPRSTGATAAMRLPSHVRGDVTKQKAREADKLRRAKISGRLDALQELLPHSKGGSKAAVLDDFIEYMKYLQCHVKALSRSRLQDESTSSPFLEEYERYLLQEHLVNEPLEEMVEKLLKQNPSAFLQLLLSKGLHVMPMDFAEGLPRGV